jgi:hypothetical protein
LDVTRAVTQLTSRFTSAWRGSGHGADISLFHPDTIDPFSKAVVSREDQAVCGAANGHEFRFFQVIHLFEQRFGLITVQTPDAKAHTVPERRDPFLSVLDLDRVTAYGQGLFEEFYQHSISPKPEVTQEHRRAFAGGRRLATGVGQPGFGRLVHARAAAVSSLDKFDDK